jgi:hypothetical protein
MGTAARRWAKGCGCGCGLLLVALGLLAWAGYRLISWTVREVTKAEEVMEEVHAKVGREADYRPAPDGALSADRMEAFLRTRELTKDARLRTDADLALLSPGDSGTAEVPGLLGRLVSWGVGISKIEAGTGLLPQGIAFVSARGKAQIETGLGPGEYLYIYALSYYGLLGKSPADGPAFRMLGDQQDGRRSGQDEFDVREGRREAVLRRINQALLPVLRAQLAALDAGGAPVEADPWRERVEAEIAAMEADRFRIPWRDGLPTAIEASITPYRARLETSYSAMCNPLEVLVGTDD